MNEHSRLRIDSVDKDTWWHVTLDAAPGNIIDLEMIRSLTEMADRAHDTPTLKAIVFSGAGAHFSYGVSIQEHEPGPVAELLPAFHDLFRSLFRARVFTIAAVTGHCLGGGLELASFCNRIVAAPGAQFGQPEIRLGVFAPAGSVFLPWRLLPSKAEELCITGRIVSAWEAFEIGLVDEIAAAPGAASLCFARKYLSKLSAVSLRHAQAATRLTLRRRFEQVIGELERAYLDDLMATDDAQEGVRAFLEKREPRWRDS
ncbi:MAG: enoyl-CoA hydratase/isomerase family protein [Planctomycetota bacterium]